MGEGEGESDKRRERESERRREGEGERRRGERGRGGEGGAGRREGAGKMWLRGDHQGALRGIGFRSPLRFSGCGFRLWGFWVRVQNPIQSVGFVIFGNY